MGPNYEKRDGVIMTEYEVRHRSLVKALFKKEGFSPLMHAVVGVASEAGELLDAAKKHVIYGKPLDMNNVVEELGDLEFYMEALRAELGVSREDTLVQNVAKLSRRYPSGVYTDAHAIARLDKGDEA
jgi:NTP pyrophosphatase (non-canonical NTP hydrolase)